MSIEDHLKPIGTLNKTNLLANTDKVVVYPGDSPLAPVGAKYATIQTLEAKVAAQALDNASAAMVYATHPDVHMYFNIIAQPTTISAITKKVLRVPQYLEGYEVCGIWLYTFSTVGATAVAGKVTVNGSDATKPAGIATGEYSGKYAGYGGKPDGGYVTLVTDDEIAVVISAGSGGSGLEALIEFSWNLT